jgi:hypothetical protein
MLAVDNRDQQSEGNGSPTAAAVLQGEQTVQQPIAAFDAVVELVRAALPLLPISSEAPSKESSVTVGDVRKNLGIITKWQNAEDSDPELKNALKNVLDLEIIKKISQGPSNFSEDEVAKANFVHQFVALMYELKRGKLTWFKNAGNKINLLSENASVIKSLEDKELKALFSLAFVALPQKIKLADSVSRGGILQVPFALASKLEAWRSGEETSKAEKMAPFLPLVNPILSFLSHFKEKSEIPESDQDKLGENLFLLLVNKGKKEVLPSGKVEVVESLPVAEGLAAKAETKLDFLPLLRAVAVLIQSLYNDPEREGWFKGQLSALVNKFEGEFKEKNPELFARYKEYIGLIKFVLQHGDKDVWDSIPSIIDDVRKLLESSQSYAKLVAQYGDKLLADGEGELLANRKEFYAALLPLINKVSVIIDKLSDVDTDEEIPLKQQLSDVLQKLLADPLLSKLDAAYRDKIISAYPGLYDKKAGLFKMVASLKDMPNGADALAELELELKKLGELQQNKSGEDTVRQAAVLGVLKKVTGLISKIIGEQDNSVKKECEAFLSSLVEQSLTFLPNGLGNEYTSLAQCVLQHGAEGLWDDIAVIADGLEKLLPSSKNSKKLAEKLRGLYKKKYETLSTEDAVKLDSEISDLKEELKKESVAFYEALLPIVNSCVSIIKGLEEEEIDLREQLIGLLQKIITDEKWLSDLYDKKDQLPIITEFLNSDANIEFLVDIEVCSLQSVESARMLRENRDNSSFSWGQSLRAKRDMYLASAEIAKRVSVLVKNFGSTLSKEERNDWLFPLILRGLGMSLPQLFDDSQHAGVDGESEIAELASTRKMEPEEVALFKTTSLAMLDMAVNSDHFNNLVEDVIALVEATGLKEDVGQIRKVVEGITTIVKSEDFRTVYNKNAKGVELCWKLINGMVEDNFVAPDMEDEGSSSGQPQENRIFTRNLRHVLGSVSAFIDKSVAQDITQEKGSNSNVAEKVEAVIGSVFGILSHMRVLEREQGEQDPENSSVIMNDRIYDLLIKLLKDVTLAATDDDIRKDFNGEFFSKLASIAAVVSSSEIAPHFLAASLFPLAAFYHGPQKNSFSAKELEKKTEEFINRLRRHMVPQQEDSSVTKDNEALAEDIAKSLEDFLACFECRPLGEADEDIKHHVDQLARYLTFLVSNLNKNTRLGQVITNLVAVPELSPEVQNTLNKGSKASGASSNTSVAKAGTEDVFSNIVTLFKKLISDPQKILQYLHWRIGFETGLTFDKFLKLLKNPAVFKVAFYAADLSYEMDKVKKGWKQLTWRDVVNRSDAFREWGGNVWEATKLSSTILYNVGSVALGANDILMGLSSQRAKKDVGSFMIITMLFVISAYLLSLITATSVLSLTLVTFSISISWLAFANYVQWQAILTNLGAFDVTKQEETTAKPKGFLYKLEQFYGIVNTNYLHPMRDELSRYFSQFISEDMWKRLEPMKAKIDNAIKTAHEYYGAFRRNFMELSFEMKLLRASVALLFLASPFQGTKLGYLLVSASSALVGGAIATHLDYSEREIREDAIVGLLNDKVTTAASIEGAEGVAQVNSEQPGVIEGAAMGTVV